MSTEVFVRYTMAAAVLALTSGCIPELYTSGASGEDWVAPENSWPMNAPPENISAQGWQDGQTPPDARLVDQNGQEVSLWQFYGEVVLFDVSTMWCAPCQELARHTEETWLDYQGEGFVYLTVLAQDVEGQSVEVGELNEWAEIFGITAPILADNEGVTAGAVSNGQYPAVLIYDRKMRLHHRVKTVNDEAEIAEAIEEVL